MMHRNALAFVSVIVLITVTPSLQLSSVTVDVGYHSRFQLQQRRHHMLGSDAQESSCLTDFEVELGHLPAEDRIFLDRAMKELPSVANNDNFRMMFLRKEGYRADSAARLFAKYWENRVALFGEEKAFLPFTQDGALKDDWEALSHGYVRAVPGHPRMVVMDPSKTPKDYNVDSVVRSVLYVLEKCLSQSLEMQRYGAVIVMDFAKARSFDRKLFAQLDKYMNQGFPFRPSVRCIVRVPRGASWVIRLLQMVSREKLHVAKTLEDLNELTGAPTVEECILDGMHHQTWLDRVRQCEIA